MTTKEEHKTLERTGYSIHYFVSGNKDKEALLFIHPAFGDHRCFDKQQDFFSKDYYIISVDLLGHGLSRVGKSSDKIDASADHIDEILKKERKEKAHVIGVSMGSLIAQYFCLKHSDKILSLTVVGGYNINKENKEVEKAQRQEVFKWLFKVLFSMNAFRRYVAKKAVNKPDQQALFYEIAKNYSRKSFSVMSGLGKIIQPRVIPKRNYPLLIMTGEFDLDLSKRQSKQWYLEDKESIFQLLENAGHCANMDQPELFNEKLMIFLKSSRSISKSIKRVNRENI